MIKGESSDRFSLWVIGENFVGRFSRYCRVGFRVVLVEWWESLGVYVLMFFFIDSGLFLGVRIF